MDERDMTIRYVAEQLGVSMTLARRYLMLWETVPTHWHRQLVLLGIPPELLPRAENKKRGQDSSSEPAPGSVCLI